ncbi:MAG: hypothetical protein IKL24_02415 [Clostridia bacterium]|nr:hypothetical protein [Clostridia bacterium]
MKRLSIVILAVLLALTTVLSASCAAPPEENAGNGNNVGNGGTEDGTEASTQPPEETEPESTADEGTEKEEESALPEDSDSSNEGTDAEDAPEPDDTDAEVPPETEPVAPPETEPVAPPETEPVVPPETEPVVQQPVPIDDAVLDQIAMDYCYYIMERYNHDPNDMVPYYVSRYYGTYDGVVIVNFQCAVEGNHSMVFVEVNIAGYIFYLSPNSINVWKDGEFYSFKEAYDLGVLTADQIGQIHSVITNRTGIKYDILEHGYPK